MHRNIPPRFAMGAIDPVESVVEVSLDAIRAYAASLGDGEILAAEVTSAPATFVLSMRRGFEPEVEIPADCFTMYGGHDLSFFGSVQPGRRYVIRSRILDQYEKSGRSGPLHVIVRQADVHAIEGPLVTRVVERQIIRPHVARGPGPATPTAAPDVADPIDNHGEHETTTGPAPTIDVGEEFGPESRRAPDATHITAYERHRHLFEQLFIDAGYAERLGFRGMIVPGPMQSALLEQFLRRQLPGWRLTSLSVNFRISIIAGESIRLAGVIIDLRRSTDGTNLECELVIENRHGERTTTGHATLIDRAG